MAVLPANYVEYLGTVYPSIETIGPSSTAVARRPYHAGINDNGSIYRTANRVCKQVSEGPVDPSSDPGLVGRECLKGYST
jgi:hypothetical protein